MSERVCGKCRWWVRIRPEALHEEDSTLLSDEVDGQVDVGHCKRFPPVIVSDLLSDVRDAPLYSGKQYVSTPHGMILAASVCPVTWAHDTCGEFEERE